MEESMVHTPTLGDENEREEPASCKTALEVSVSFGRFENEPLSWERWSSFSQNKYLEEVEKCSTPGSVAEKKAYFEAHYKKIPSRNISEQRGQEVRMEAHTLESNGTISGDLITSGCEFNAESSPSINDARESKSRTNSVSFMSSSNADELNKDAEVTDSNKEAALEVDCQGSFGEEVKEELEGSFDSPKSRTNSLSFMSSSNADELNKDAEVTDSNKEAALEVDCRGSFGEEVKEELEGSSDSPKSRTNSLSFMSSSNADELNKDAEVTDSNKEAALEVDLRGSFGEEMKEELEGRFDSPKSNTLDIGTLVEENSPMRSQATTDLPQQFDDGAVNTQENKVEDSKLKPPKESQKDLMFQRIPATKKNSLTRIKNSSASLTPKSPQISIPGSSKFRLAPSVMPTTQTPVRNGSRSSLQTSRNLSTVESRRSTTASLSKSLTLQPENSDSASLMTTRKSLIMEKMGDKEIVKRAFKAFQYRFNQLKATTETEPSAAGQVSTKVKGQTKSALMTRQKDMEGTQNEGVRARAPRMKMGAGENARAPRTQMGARHNSVSARPFKAASVDYLHSAPSSPFVLRSSERAEKRKEFLKKLEEKSNAKEVKKMQLQSKSKEEKDAGIRKLRQSLNFKATPLPDFYGGQVSKSLVK